MPTATLEEYLEAIYKLSGSEPVRPYRLADAMDVSAPTVTATLRRLADRGLITRPGRAIELTPEGEREALSILRRHRLAERFLVDVLGLPWDGVHEEACLLEHALSPRVQDALEAYMDNPDACPHGHPIPTSELVVAEGVGVPLTEVEAGSIVRVENVDERNEGTLTLASSLGLYPGTLVRVIEATSLDGSILLDVGGERSALDRGVAAQISVIREEA